MDFVFPDKNEEEFIKVAEYLGIEQLCFLYTCDFRQNSERLKGIKTKIGLKSGAYCDGRTARRAKKHVDIVVSEGDVRKLLSNSSVDVVIGAENDEGPDYMHHRNSGLNHVICRIAHEKNKAIGFSFSRLLNSRRRALLLGRIRQNIKLCRKYKAETVSASFAKKPMEMRADYRCLFQ